ncbi:CRASP family complement regulator-acquiring lipoprotein [Borreliella garinii]|uniref:CRASP family complement regulator-acquiring lipoprotein n=1 Tax=Borreliella garinii TaxID=29519 RepID=UPI000D7C0875
MKGIVRNYREIGPNKKQLNKLDTLENSIDSTIVHLCFKEDTLEKPNTLNLKKLKDSFEQLFSIRTIVSKALIKPIFIRLSKR